MGSPRGHHHNVIYLLEGQLLQPVLLRVCGIEWDLPSGEGPSCRLCRLCGVVSREQQMFALPWCAHGSSLEKLTCVQDLDQGHPTHLRLSVTPWAQPVSRSSFGATCHRMGNFACFCQCTCTRPGDLQLLPVRCVCLLTVINGFPWCRQLCS